VKYEEVYLHAYASVPKARASLVIAHGVGKKSLARRLEI
jgi:hypothetical protein